uniref:Uncharacterized protein n=1 Tax=Rhizophora mucronata TaxID=61149 RepID=A0A2P2Q8Q8_RHIMU
MRSKLSRLSFQRQPLSFFLDWQRNFKCTQNPD